MRQKSQAAVPALEQRVFQDRSVRETRGADVSEITEEEFGKYWIKAGVLSGTCVARAFPKPPAKTQAMIANASGDTPAQAIEALKVLLKGRDRRRSTERRLEKNSGTFVPSESEYIEALRQIRLSTAQITMLKSISIAGKEGITVGQLASVGGYRSREAAIKVFKKAGFLIAEYLELDVSEAKEGYNDGEAQVLAFSHIGSEDEPAKWIMHRELSNAVRAVL